VLVTCSSTSRVVLDSKRSAKRSKKPDDSLSYSGSIAAS
jgi:hypothetical protein